MANLFNYCYMNNVVFNELFSQSYSPATSNEPLANMYNISVGGVGRNLSASEKRQLGKDSVETDQRKLMSDFFRDSSITGGYTMKAVGQHASKGILIFKRFESPKNWGGSPDDIDSDLTSVKFAASDDIELKEDIRKIGFLPFINEIGYLIKDYLIKESPDILNIEEIRERLMQLASRGSPMGKERMAPERLTLFLDKAIKNIIDMVNKGIKIPTDTYVLRKNNTHIMKQKTIKQAAQVMARRGINPLVNDPSNKDSIDFKGWDGRRFNRFDFANVAPDRSKEEEALAQYRRNQASGRQLSAALLGEPQIGVQQKQEEPQKPVPRYMRPPLGGNS